MQKVIFSLVIFLFLIWLLPLGVFIKSSNEKVACDGQRAVCMCHHSMVKATSNSIEGFGFKNNSGSNKESSTPGGGAGNYFLASNVSPRNVLNTFIFHREILIAEAEPFLRSIEHVPKA